MTDYLERLLEEQWEQEDERDEAWELSPVRVARENADTRPEPGTETAAAVEQAAGQIIDRAGEPEPGELEAVRQTASQAARRACAKEEQAENGEAPSEKAGAAQGESPAEAGKRAPQEARGLADRLSARLNWQAGWRNTPVPPGADETVRRDAEGEQGTAGERQALLWETGYGRTDGWRYGESLEGPPTDGGARWADQAVRASLAALPGQEKGSGVITVERTVDRPGEERLEAQRLDRLFRRDARRYDGGYQLL